MRVDSMLLSVDNFRVTCADASWRLTLANGRFEMTLGRGGETESKNQIPCLF